MNRRRIASVAAAVVLVAAVVVAVVVSRGGGGSSKPKVTLVHGVIGSEKQPFFADPRVIKEFAAHGYEVQVDTAGSREIATTTDLSKYDFAFPAGTPSADKIRQKVKAARVYVPFFTPMAIATYTPIVDLLRKAGAVTAQADGTPLLDVKKYLALTAKNTRWTDLPGNTTYPAGKSLLITSTDVTKSNSAAMYLSITSYVANGDNVVAAGDVAKVLPQVAPLFTRQGYTDSSSEEPFNDYLSIGIGKTPMVMIYEAQYRAEQARSDSGITKDMTLLYPNPTVLSKHTVVPLDANGDAIGSLLVSDPKLQELAVEYGFRTSNTAVATTFATQHKLPPLPSLVNIVDPPAFDTLEQLITSIGS